MKKFPGDYHHFACDHWFMVPEIKWNKRCNRHKFLSFWVIFCPFSPLKTQKINIKKLKKKTPGEILSFTHLQHKWQSYDIWFLRYGVQQTEFFVILDHFLPFCPPPLRTQKIKILKKWKKHLKIFSFHKCVP